MVWKRSEFGKSVRKDYEKGDVKYGWKQMKELTPRDDGCTNTITSFPSDNIIMEFV